MAGWQWQPLVRTSWSEDTAGPNGGDRNGEGHSGVSRQLQRSNPEEAKEHPASWSSPGCPGDSLPRVKEWLDPTITAYWSTQGTWHLSKTASRDGTSSEGPCAGKLQAPLPGQWMQRPKDLEGPLLGLQDPRCGLYWPYLHQKWNSSLQGSKLVRLGHGFGQMAWMMTLRSIHTCIFAEWWALTHPAKLSPSAESST